MIEDACKKSKIDNKHKSALFDYVNSFVDDVNITQSKITKLKYIMDIMLSAYDIEDDEVLDKLLDDKTVKNQPKTKEELKQIINDTIKEKGNECDLNFIDTSLITDMSGLFEETNFNGDISNWNVSNVRSMSGMFYNSSFNGDISDWNVSNVKYMYSMFKNSIFNRDISNWDVSRVLDHENIFDDCPLGNSIKYQPKFKD